MQKNKVGKGEREWNGTILQSWSRRLFQGQEIMNRDLNKVREHKKLENKIEKHFSY